MSRIDEVWQEIADNALITDADSEVIKRIISQYALDCCHDTKLFQEAWDFAKDYDEK